jgi:hypothetical protein
MKYDGWGTFELCYNDAMNTCTTENCINVAKYVILKEREQKRYCLPCIQKIKELSLSS